MTSVADADPAFARVVALAVDELKAEDVNILDVVGLTDVMDYMVIATGTSERHLKAMSTAVEAAAGEEGRTLLGVEGESASGWIVVDAGDVVAHLFTGALRAYYDLDGLWADAKVVRPDEAPRREDAEREATD